MLRSVFYTILTVYCFSVSAQQPVYTHQQLFKVEDGLPQSFISGIIQDKDGFIWIGTLDGLARYDGRGFKIFRQQQGDTNSLSSNVINLLARDRNDHIWIKYQGQQLDSFDPITFRVKHANNNPLLQKAIIPHNSREYDYINNDWIFLPGKGVGWVNSSTGEETFANTANGKLKNDTVVSAVQETSGELWLVSPAGIHIADKDHRNFEWISFPSRIPVDPNSNPYTQSILLPGKKLVIGQPDKLIVADVHKKTFSIITIPPGKNKAIEFPLNSLQTDSHGQLYIRNSGRIFRLEKNSKLTLIWENLIVKDRRITSFLVDRTDVLWVGIDAGGLAKINLRSMPFTAAMYEHNFHTDILTQAGIPLKALPGRWVNSKWSYNFRYAYGSDSALYISNVDSLFEKIYCWQNSKFFHLPFPAGMQAHFRGVYVTGQGEVWALDNLNYGFWHWRNNHTEPVFIPISLPVNARNNYFADLLMTGNIQWMSTYGKGLFELENGKSINQFDKNSTRNTVPFDLTDLCADPKDPDKFWIGSLGGGLIGWDSRKGLVKTFTTENGLPNNTVYSVVPDFAGSLWLSTNKGICRFDPRDHTINVFEKTDGLSGNEFNRFHQFLFPDGHIAFGGPDGYTVFNPADFSLKKDSFQTAPQITGIQINNQLQDFTKANSYVDQPYNQLQQLELPYNKNYLTVEFAALLFNEPQKIRYRYKLSGVNENWNEASGNFAQYTQLRPGNYTLFINATDLDGQWSSAIRQLVIRIHPPFWATWWAYTLYILLALALVRAYWKYREKSIRNQQQLLFEHRETERLRELDKMKEHFFSNITHEFRTPLSLIVTPLERLGKDTTLSEPARHTIQAAQRNTGQLLRLINQLLDLSKVEAGQMKLAKSVGELNYFVKECIDAFAERAAENKVKLVFSSKEVEGLYSFDKEKWEKIIANLTSNALKFTPAGGVVKISLEAMQESTTDNRIRFMVEDTGPGIEEAELPKIFDRFYQAGSGSLDSHSGTGIGLSLIKELIRLMNGTISVQSKPGSGAMFIVELPAERVEKTTTAFSGEEMPAIATFSTEALMPVQETIKEKPLLLIVEDSEELRSYMAESLSAKCRTIQAAEGLSGWELILKEMPDLVISDVMMPGRDGFELCSLCKTDNRTAHIGFILLTSRAAHDARIAGLETGADEYITKPFHLDELELRIHNLLQLQERMKNYLKAQALPKHPMAGVPQVQNEFLQHLYKTLDDNLDDPHLSVEFLAKALNMSRSSLNRKLGAILDISANDLIRTYRLQKAAIYLVAGHSITDTAYTVGFTTPSYFAKCFKDQYDITPSDFISSQ